MKETTLLTYDVRIWGIRSRNSKKAPFQLRWVVGGVRHQQPFLTKPLADGRRSQLMGAVRDGEQFDTETGLPVSELRLMNSPTWYQHACEYALMKWPKAAAKHRVGIAEALANITPVLVSSSTSKPDPEVLRLALRSWAFQVVRTDDGEYKARKDAEAPPADVVEALEWVAKYSIKVTDVADSARLRLALTALSRKLDGRPAADNTFRRKRTVLSNALRYAVERGLLPANPLPSVDWDPPATDDEVDFEFVPGPDQARRLLDAVRAQGTRGEHLHAFFACMYYAAMRPSEVAALMKRHCKLSAAGWGELVLRSSRPEVGAGWTDDGKSYEERGLKRRARRATRPVPIPPVLVGILRAHVEQFGTAPDGRLFRAVQGGRVRSTEYTEVWQEARGKALAPEEVDTPLAEKPYSLRHAGVSLWIKAGVDPVEVARRAGHSPAVLWKFYAKILRGQQQASNQLIDNALAASEAPAEP
ncbi:tyrosine-type recombinase/integrase [Streptomyces roseolilacinus]|uniref:Site-specific integrase n=1 Tax=Streptomyces roseolilacinus TaxID=66904 RepID=A0A918B1P2_9ACTN|nr:site-specific integrase [Streptomyces roseolilacinus]GGQ12257.1 site-specific integrase [Streptomyces roseolilacinus]